MRCSDGTFRSSAPGACSRTTPSPACSATRPRRRRWSICYAVMGWRGAFLCAAALGVVAAIFVFLTHASRRSRRSPPRRRKSRPTPGRRLEAPALGADPRQSPVLHPALDVGRRTLQLSRGDARRAVGHAGDGRQHRADRPADHERGRRAGRRPAHRLHQAPRRDHHHRPAVHRAPSACWSG